MHVHHVLFSEITTARALIGRLHSRVLADAKTAMKFAFLLVVLALFGVAADARVVPLETPQLGVAQDAAPALEVSFSEEFLAQAAAPGAGHKLPYSNPATGACQKSEEKVSISGIPGAFCSPKCGPNLPCPENTHFGSTAAGQCVLETPGTSQPSQCALICHPSVGGCPKGASCQPIQGLGVCTYASGPETSENDAEDAEVAVADLKDAARED